MRVRVLECACVVVLLTEIDEEAPVASSLVLRENHDAGHIVLLLTVLLLQSGHTQTHLRAGTLSQTMCVRVC